MSSEYVTCVINGKLCRIREGHTVGDLMKSAGIGEDETLVRVSHAGAAVCAETDIVVPGEKYRSIPPTIQGGTSRSFSDSFIHRIEEEIAILAREIGGRGTDGERIKVGRVRVGQREYTGVIIENLSVNPGSFGGVKSVRALLLLPPDYPRQPPIGVYVNRKHNVATPHFVHRGYHGAPTLKDKGWYWFCHGVGGLDAGTRRRLWRPAPEPADGHNLATVVAAARVAMNATS